MRPATVRWIQAKKTARETRNEFFPRAMADTVGSSRSVVAQAIQELSETRAFKSSATIMDIAPTGRCVNGVSMV